MSQQKQAKIALQAYLERGRQAREALRRRQWDLAESLLVSRSVAFHNFRAADFQHYHFSNSEQYMQEVDQMWPKIDRLNDELSREILNAQNFLKQSVSIISQQRTKIAKFHSGSQTLSRLNSKI